MRAKLWKPTKQELEELQQMITDERNREWYQEYEGGNEEE